MMIVVPKTNNIDNIDENKELFTIQYTKEEMDKITLNFVTRMNNYIARVNNRIIIKTLEEIEKETTTAVVVVVRGKSYKDDDYTF
jgi:hypothetical protein